MISAYDADVIICSGDKRGKAHRLILTLCSDFFYDIFKDYPVVQETATIIIPELNQLIVDPLIAFMYTGQVFIEAELVNEFVNACKLLKLKGVIQYSSLKEKNSEIEYFLEDSTSQDVDEIESYDDHIAMDEEYIVENVEQNQDENENTESQQEMFADTLLTVDGIEPIVASTIPDEEHSNTIEVLAYHSDGEDDDNDYMDEIENGSSGEAEEYDEMKEFHNSSDPEHNVVSPDPDQCDGNKKSFRKYYTESTLIDAFNDLANGATILDTSKKYNVPRSTLYCKIRSNTKYSYLYRSIRASAIQDATNAVVFNKLSLQQAASQFGIAKTVLWRRLRQSDYKPEDKSHAYREQAIKAIEEGEKLLNVSKMYNIPISTLHRDKVKLMEQGKLPKHCTVVKRELGPEFKKRVEAALESCRNGMTQKMSSELHNVPKTTIWRYMNAKNEKILTNQ